MGDDAGMVGSSGASSGDDAGGHIPNPNPCPAPGTIKNYTLPGLSVSDFCDAYEKYCKYVAGSMAKCGPGQKVGPLLMNRADCEMQYTNASMAGKACRAGQLCHNAQTPGIALTNPCSHASGYCDPTCGT
jgi:hypothetical protein